MKLVIDIPVPDKQGIVDLSVHFVDGQACECTYPFEELSAVIDRMMVELFDWQKLEPGHLAETYRAVDRAIEIQDILTKLHREYQDTENGAAGEDVRWWNAGIRRAIEIVENS